MKEFPSIYEESTMSLRAAFWRCPYLIGGTFSRRPSHSANFAGLRQQSLRRICHWSWPEANTKKDSFSCFEVASERLWRAKQRPTFRDFKFAARQLPHQSDGLVSRIFCRHIFRIHFEQAETLNSRITLHHHVSHSPHTPECPPSRNLG